MTCKSVAANRRPSMIAAALWSTGRLAITTMGACAVIAVAAGAAFASASFADVPNSGTEGPSPRLAKEMAVFTSKGISPERAGQALDVQGKIAQADLTSRVEAAMGSAYAGAWFDAAAPRVHFGVTSALSRQAAQQIVAQAGLTAFVTFTPVRSTWSALMAVQTWWNKRLVDLDQDVMTGLDAQRNAVVVTLSSSVPAGERAALEREAATGSVNVFVEIAPQSHLGAEPLATCKKFKTFEAYCEKTLVSGVGWYCSRKAGERCDVTETEPVGPQCSAGPLLIEGNETYMLTAGHCFAKEVGEEGLVGVKVTSAYPEKEEPAQKEIGKSGEWKYLLAKDMATVKVTRPGSFTQALPTPVPALMMEWGVKTETPSAVLGEAANMKGEANCRVGMTTGEKCGEILRVNISTPGGFEHLVEDTACAEGGDSGGPFFFNGGKVNNVTMQGMLVRGEKKCGEEGAKTWYEPLKDEGAVGFGILSNFAGKVLLTTANETRPKISLWLWLPGANGTTFTDKSGEASLAEKGGGTITCTSSTSTGVITAELTLGLTTIDFKGCKAEKLAAVNSLGDPKEVILVHVELHNCVISPGHAGILFKPLPLHLEIPLTSALRIVGGSFIALVEPNKTKAKEFKLNIKQSKGAQEIEKCEGGSKETLTSETNENGKLVESGEEAKEATFTFTAEQEAMA